MIETDVAGPLSCQKNLFLSPSKKAYAVGLWEKAARHFVGWFITKKHENGQFIREGFFLQGVDTGHHNTYFFECFVSKVSGCCDFENIFM